MSTSFRNLDTKRYHNKKSRQENDTDTNLPFVAFLTYFYVVSKIVIPYSNMFRAFTRSIRK